MLALIEAMHPGAGALTSRTLGAVPFGHSRRVKRTRVAAGVRWRGVQQKRCLLAAVNASGGDSASSSGATLVLYTKPGACLVQSEHSQGENPGTLKKCNQNFLGFAGCCLCEGMEEKLGQVLAAASFQPASPLHGIALEPRDVSTREDWADAYAGEVPVLELALPEGDERPDVRLPRPAPRLSAARLSPRLAAQVAAALAGDEPGEVGEGNQGSQAVPKSGAGWVVNNSAPW